jgi:hypothetical protein
MNQKERIKKWKSRGIVISDFSEYEALYNKAKGECEACGKKLSLENGNSDEPTAQLDHDHKTGIPRGILCANCNRSIGQLETYNYKNRHGVAKYLLKDLNSVSLEDVFPSLAEKAKSMTANKSSRKVNPPHSFSKLELNINNSPGKPIKEEKP